MKQLQLFMVYHETQKYQYCAVHAVNALLGYPAFSVRVSMKISCSISQLKLSRTLSK
jgi:hypothetical protein